MPAERMSAAEYRASVGVAPAGVDPEPSGPGRDKRRVRGTEQCWFRGERFDSKRELRTYQLLLDRERRGEIRDIKRQIDVPLLGRDGPLKTPTGRDMVWRCDFAYTHVASGEKIFADAKGHPTEKYLIKRAILAAQGIVVVEL